MTEQMGQDDAPATVEQVAEAMAALGFYNGENTPEEHSKEAARLGGPDVYRVRMVNALLGLVQAETIRSEQAAGLGREDQLAAWEEQLVAAGSGLDNPTARLEFLRWQVLRVATPLRLIAQHRETGPIPVAAAHATNGLQGLLGVVAASQGAVAAGDAEKLAAQVPELVAAREALKTAIDNADLLLNMVKSAGL